MELTALFSAIVQLPPTKKEPFLNEMAPTLYRLIYTCGQMKAGNRWLDDGENLMGMLPFLREYMGHNSLSETAYYIHILSENIVKSSAIDWDKFNAMFPEVTD